MKLSYFLLIASVSILTGCAGFNTTVFTTKSNVGLDIEEPPSPTPTAEITIARKEAVIEPSFGAGQTPPVMASYKPNVGFTGGIKNFALGVDQTFAGGDAAIAMAELYDAPTDKHPDWADYDSTLLLSNGLKTHWPHTLRDPQTADDIRPFVFTTDTLLGLKFCWNNASYYPDSVKAGFNRKEFAWAPISAKSVLIADPNHAGNSVTNTSIKMPSFLATIQGNYSGAIDTNVAGVINGRVASIQFFASGRTATYLALQKDVRNAMLTRMDPGFKHGSIQNSVVLGEVLSSMFTAFSQLPADEKAVFYHNRLSNLSGIGVPETFDANTPPLAYCSFNSPTKTLTYSLKYAVNKSPNLTLATVTAYLSNLQDSTIALQQASLIIPGLTLVETDPATGKPVAPLSGVLTNPNQIPSQLLTQNQALHKLKAEIAANEDIREALEYFTSLMKPQ